MNQLLIKEEKTIEDMIYEVRGKQVMLASDVAILYNSETKIINQVVKRNINRFPDDFCFQLTLSEWLNLRSHFVTSSEDKNKIKIKEKKSPFSSESSNPSGGKEK